MNVDQALLELESLSKQKIAERCRRDLFFLCKYVLGYEDLTYSTHGDLCRYTQNLIANEGVHTTVQETIAGHREQDQFDPKKNFLLLLMPRGTFKSSVVTIGFSLQFILNDPDARILIDSETFSKSKAFLAEIKGHLDENEKFREVFHTIYGTYPDAKKRDTLYSDSQLNISARKRTRKEPTFSCAGIDVTKTGMHYDLIIADDLMSEKNITTREQIEQVVTHYKLCLSLLDPGKPFIVIGTRWDYNDVYQYILDYEADRFNILVRKAVTDEGSLFFPERLTQEFLDATKKSQGSYIFSCQYMNEPVDNETATFKRSNLLRKPWELVKDVPTNWYVSIDPSFEGPYSDYCAFILAGMTYDRDLVIREVHRAKMNYSDIIELMFDWYQRYNPKRIILETIAQQKSLQYMLNDEQKRRGAWLPVQSIPYRVKSKEDRIKALAPYYEFHHAIHVAECRQLDDFEYELIHFPRGTHDDMIDALASVLEVATPPNERQYDSNKREKRNKMFSILDKPRSPLTGV